MTLYCEPDHLAAFFGDAAANLDSTGVADAVEAASRWIDDYTGRRFYLDPVDALTTKTYRPEDAYTAWVDDIGSTTGLVIKTDDNGDGTWTTTWDSTDYQLEPLNPVGAHSYTRIVAVGSYAYPSSYRRVTLQVTAQHGWSAVPGAVTQAAIICAAALYERRSSPLGIASGLGDYGPMRVSRYVDPDVARLLAPYVRYDLLVA